MRITLFIVYWFLLCVSVISSGLLFFIVSSEEYLNTSSLTFKEDKSEVLTISAEEQVKRDTPENVIENEIFSANGDAFPNIKNVPIEGQIESMQSHNFGISSSVPETENLLFTVKSDLTTELKEKADITSQFNGQTITVESNLNYSQNAPRANTISGANIPETISLSETSETQPEVTTAEIPVEAKEIETNVSVKEVESLKNESVDTSFAAKEHEDIPSFSEWTQKQLEEAEKNKDSANISAQSQNQNVKQSSSNLKKRSKNYASPDCGAKIVASNPEAISAGAVLSPSKDEYKLNTCNSKIWFVVELCEAIQAKKIDLANFELFSSSPKDFSVSVSDRFPTKDWLNVGTFTANDERDVQTFDLNPHLFGRFIRVDVHSHYGSEHYCPISLFRAYGTSEFEVLDSENQIAEGHHEPDDEFEDEVVGADPTASKNFFGSARDTVISMVKKAAEALVSSKDGANKTDSQKSLEKHSTPLVNSCTTPSHKMSCPNCSDLVFGKVYEFLSCNPLLLNKYLNNELINRTIYESEICSTYGLTFSNSSVCYPEDYFVMAFFSDKHIAALCNLVGVIENKVVLNISRPFANISLDGFAQDITSDLKNSDNLIPEIPLVDPLSVCQEQPLFTETSKASQLPVTSTEHNTNIEIKPTKVLSGDDIINEYNDKQSQSSTTLFVDSSSVGDSETSNDTGKNVKPEESLKGDTLLNEELTISATENSSTFENEPLENLIKELENDQEKQSSTPPPSQAPQQAQKESVFLRLSNRIKTLERNMSLSSQYLEELSRRYKKLNEESKRSREREQRLLDQISNLTEIVNTLIAENNGWSKQISWLGQILLVEFCFGVMVVYLCWRSPSDTASLPIRVPKHSKTRRSSIGVVEHGAAPSLGKRQRRPSEEALQIIGTYESLLINEDQQRRAKAERRRRRRRLLRSRSNANLKDIGEGSGDDEPARRASSSELHSRYRVTKNVSGKQELILNETGPVRIEEIPVPLEESENSPLEPVNIDSNLQSSVMIENYSALKGGNFMATAVSQRKKRNSVKHVRSNSDVTNTKYTMSTNEKTNADPFNPSENVIENGVSSKNSLSSSGTISKKEKKTWSFKRLVKKAFE